MRYEIILASEAVEDLKRLKAHVLARVRDALDDVVEDQVHVLAIIAKSDAGSWLDEFGDEE